MFCKISPATDKYDYLHRNRFDYETNESPHHKFRKYIFELN